ncbi:DUF3298 domain-containing protein [uncultured Brachyspira sp.]|uniref:DUF3298 domain-containing protein n=1 Tax=uncultured Brachyspira sp. TaxID=221953 RepID=UPI0025FC2697|nr:DUF3298 domain-containing protein [uncultured Brachyspira sp.]
MVRIFLIFFILIIISCNSDKYNNDDFFNDEIEISEFYLLEGNISGEDASMYLYVNEKKGKLSGYYYTKDKKALISGSIKNNKLILNEIDKNNNIYASISGNLSDDIIFNAEIRYDETNEVKDMEFHLNRNLPVYYADIIDYYKNESISNSIFSYHRTLLSFRKNNNKEDSDIETSLNYIEEECSNYYNEWKTLISDNTGNITYEIDNTVNVGYIDDKVIALDNYSLMYTGGYDKTSVNIQEVFSLESSNLITIRDLIGNFNNNNLISLMREKILMSGRNEEDYYDFNTVTLESSTFRILPNSINFIWQTDDIAPYSLGITEISFDFKELKPYIREDSPLYYLFL